MPWSEAAIVRRVVAALRARGAWAEKIHGSPYQRAGLPDVDCVYRGRAVKLEVKRPGERPTRVQLRVLGELQAAGAVTAVVTSDVEALLILDEIDQELAA